MLKILALVAACAFAANAEKLTWNAQSVPITGSALWNSEGDDAIAPGDEDNADKISEIQFGNEDYDSVLSVPVSNDLHTGLKITFNSATKLVLGNGKGSTKLIFDGSSRGSVLTYIPGSGISEETDVADISGSSFDVMCHTNWVTSSGEYKKPDSDGNILGPCDDDDLVFDEDVFFKNGKSNSRARNAGVIFAQLIGDTTRYFKSVMIGDDDLTCKDNELSIDEETGMSYQLDFGICGNRNANFRIGEDVSAKMRAKACASSCPPLLKTEDGAQVVKIGDTVKVIDSDGKVTNDPVKLTDEDGKEIDAANIVDASKVKVAVTIDGQEYEADGAKKTVPTESSTPEATTKPKKSTKKPSTDDDANNDDDDDDDKGSNDDGGDTQASSGTKDSDDGSMIIIIVVVVVVVLLVIIAAAVVVVMKSKAGGAGNRSVVSFENPMYDQSGQPKQNPSGYATSPAADGTYAEPYTGNQGSSGYMDVQPGQAGTTGYMDVQPGQAGTTGYMDVQPGQAGTTGYMDVAPNHDDDDGEDV